MASSPGTAAAREPRFDSGRICLDLLATTHPCEHLDSLPRLLAWCAAEGLLPPGSTPPAAGPHWTAAFHELRGCVGSLVVAELEGRAPRPTAALARVNDLASKAPPVPRAVPGADGRLVRTLLGEPGCDALLSLLARDTVDLLTDPVARGRLRRCAGDNCPLIYLDTSRGHRRRWCSSESCGNRERVARHRRRAAREAAVGPV
ncbi:CGNR zinc finger domain-containing protein [Streptomyces sp. NPDC050560]|uniref:CGNR zinc finger domain-containing protein n=1 Tax=Streptomyces sp. NPDC050560 TaxID=3365630 RepID=UPI003795BCCE